MNSRIRKKKSRAKSKEFFKGCPWNDTPSKGCCVYSYKAQDYGFDFVQSYTCKPKQRHAYKYSLSWLLKLGHVRDSSGKGRKQ